MRGVPALVALCAAAALLPATANADTVWKGKTKQGRKVVLSTDGRGLVTRVKIGWKARCGDGTYSSKTIFVPPFDTSTATEVADVGDYNARPDGYRSAIHVWMKGAWVASSSRWRGTFGVRVRVSKDGELVDTCRLKKLRWSAGRA
jgi:hypothetical protein